MRMWIRSGRHTVSQGRQVRGRRRALVVLGVMTAASAAVAPVGAAAGGAAPHVVFHPPQESYLALGDSLAFGYQQAKLLAELGSGTYSAASFNTGYDADFAAMIQPLAPPGHPFTETNFGCPGETTTSMVDGPCPFPLPLHNSYPPGDSQLEAAVAFLQAHRHHVNPVTLDIGANDILGLIEGCGFAPACIAGGATATTATMASNLDAILTALQAAAPGAEIIAMNVPDVFEFAAPSTLPLFAAYNAVLDQVVAAHGVRLVDAFSVVAGLSLSDFCADDAFCGPLHDIHPTDAGYAVLAQYFFTASGYAALG